MISLILLAISSFAATNIDDIFILSALFSSKKLHASEIILGQFFGIGILICIAILGHFVANILIPIQWIKLAGIIPLLLGLKVSYEVLTRQIDKTDGINQKRILSRSFLSSLLSVSAITVSNGGDNIGVYTPLFAKFTTAEMIFVISIYFILIGLWCATGYFIAEHTFVGKKLEKYGHAIMPIVLILLGIFILLR